MVGYQNKDATEKATIWVNMFPNTSGKEMTLGDIMANSFDDTDGDAYGTLEWTGFVPFSDFIQTMNTVGKFTGKYTYVPDGYKVGVAQGWYDFKDKTCKTEANSVEIPFTHGFYLASGDGNGGLAPMLSFCGNVKPDPTIVSVASSSMLTGNCTPVDITLGQITANSFDDTDGETYGTLEWTGFVPFSDFIQVMNDKGKFIGKYTYAPAGYKNGNVAGWYEFTDKECTDCVNDSVVIKAGQAVYVSANDGNGGLAPTITIPSAL